MSLVKEKSIMPWRINLSKKEQNRKDFMPLRDLLATVLKLFSLT
jgi:hypothetical protein